MANKILGYFLILIGLAIIFSTLYGSYKIFTGGIPAPEVFSIPDKDISSPGGKIQDLQAQMEEVIRKQIGDILPVDSIFKLLNLIALSILAGILIFGGSQVAGIGVKLLFIKNN